MGRLSSGSGVDARSGSPTPRDRASFISGPHHRSELDEHESIGRASPTQLKRSEKRKTEVTAA